MELAGGQRDQRANVLQQGTPFRDDIRLEQIDCATSSLTGSYYGLYPWLGEGIEVIAFT